MKDNHYIPLKVKLIEDISGIKPSVKAMRLPMDGRAEVKTNSELAESLIKAGNDHAKFQRGIIAYIEMQMQVGFMIQFETYRHGIECLSTSSAMHSELRGLSGAELASKKQEDLVDKVYKRVVMMSYQALRNIYKARRHHLHPDWQIFCDFIEKLPFFDTLIYPEFNKE